MAKYHISTQGEPAVCRAILRMCPRGGAENHFPNREQALTEIEHRHRVQYGEVSRKSNRDNSAKDVSIVDKIEHDTLSAEELMVDCPTITGSPHHEALGITVKRKTGKLVDKGCFNQYAITGTLNRDDLTAQSHREFGFQSVIMEDSLHTRSMFTPFDPQLNYLVSQAETRDLPVIEKSALNFFSTQNYKWFTPYITDPSTMNNLPEGYEGDDDTLISYEDVERVNRQMGVKAFDPDNFVEQNSPEKITQNNIRHVVQHLDSALSKGAKTQRIVYRGVSFGSPIFDGYSSARQYAKENLKLGSVIEFSAYQSASAKADIGHAYARQGTGNGIIYEILTPEGVNITDVSDVTSECEVLLPRNQRYTVVGNHTMMTGDYAPGRSSVAIVQLVAVNKNGEILDGTNADPVEPFPG